MSKSNASSMKSSLIFSKKSKLSFTLRPSESHRWSHCSASPFFLLENDDRIDKSDSVYAKEGTLAHDLGANSLLMGWDADDFKDPEMGEYVKGYTEFCQNQIGEGDKMMVEKSVPLYYQSSEKKKGTTDCAIISIDTDRKVITKVRINDLKYGMGVSVQAKNNPQLVIYAMSVIENLLWRDDELGIDDKALITIAIYQPRIIGERPIRLWVLDYAELAKEAHDLQQKVNVITEAKSWDDVEFQPGENVCRFCEAKAFCKSYAGYLLEEVPEVSEALDAVSEENELVLPSPRELSIEKISILVASRKELVKWLSSLEEYAKAQISSGHLVPGLKIVQGRQGDRRYMDQELAKKFLRKYLPGHVVETISCISPAQAEKAVKTGDFTEAKRKRFAEAFADLLTRSPGGPTLTLESDKRESIVESIEDEFAFAKEDLYLLS